MQTTIILHNNGGDFDALNSLRKWCAENDYAMGSPQRDAPIGLMKDKERWSVSKWRNMSDAEQESLSGVATWRDGGPRLGDCVIELR